MTQKDFIEVTKEIEKFYGTKEKPKELNSTELKIWFKELEKLKLSKEIYRQVARECFKTSQYMPKLATIVDLYKQLLKKQNNQEEFEYEECHYCFGDGIFEVMYINAGIIYSVGARCVCKNGNRYPKMPNIRQFGILREDNTFGNTKRFKLKEYVFNRRSYFFELQNKNN